MCVCVCLHPCENERRCLMWKRKRETRWMREKMLMDRNFFCWCLDGWCVVRKKFLFFSLCVCLFVFASFALSCSFFPPSSQVLRIGSVSLVSWLCFAAFSLSLSSSLCLSFCPRFAALSVALCVSSLSSLLSLSLCRWFCWFCCYPYLSLAVSLSAPLAVSLSLSVSCFVSISLSVARFSAALYRWFCRLFF